MTLAAEPGPMFVTRIENVIGSPAWTVVPSGVFSTLTSGQLTVIWPLSVLFAGVMSPVAVMLTVLFFTPQAAEVVGEVI